MNVSASLAKAVEFNPDGSFSILGGGMNVVRVTERAGKPAPLPSLFLFVNVERTDEEARQEHVVTLRAVNPDGSVNTDAQSLPFRVQPDCAHPRIPPTFRCAFNLLGMELPDGGLYQLHVFVDGQLQKVVALYADKPLA